MSKVKFYCDECGAHVPLDARICPKCGSVFEAVRCPKCAFTGYPVDFAGGCPSCGYLGNPVFITPEGAVDLPGQGGRDEIALGDRSFTENARRKPLNLPSWAYTVIVVILLGLIIVLLALFSRL